MSIEDVVSRFCVQTAVYWGNPTKDGYGGYTYDEPVEISCRWEQEVDVYTPRQGVQYFSNAKVMVTQDLDVEGYLYLGSLSDLDPNDERDPEKINGAYKIAIISKIPMVKKTDDFVRIIYLKERYFD